MSGVRLQPGQTAVVGYGLLLAPGTVESTLGRPYDGPFVHGRMRGWRRRWTVTMPNQAFYFESDRGRVYPDRILYLDAAPSPGEQITCSVFVVDDADLARLDAREWIYDRVVVTDDLQEVSVTGGDAVVYSGREEHRLVADDPARSALRRSYLAMFDRVLGTLPEAMRNAFWATTEPVPEHLVIDDTLDPDRPNPWEAAGKGFDPTDQG